MREERLSEPAMPSTECSQCKEGCEGLSGSWIPGTCDGKRKLTTQSCPLTPQVCTAGPRHLHTCAHTYAHTSSKH